MASLSAITKPLQVPTNPMNAIYGALASGNQSGLLGAGSPETNAQINNTFYQQGVANPWYQQNQAALNRTGAAYQPGGMFYNPAIDGPGAGGPPAGGGGATPPPAAGGGAGAGYLGPPTGNVQSSAGAGPVGQPNWANIDVSKFLDPNVQWRIGQGTAALENSAAAKGGLLSGSALKGISDYANNQAGQAYADAQNAAFRDRDFMRGTYTNDRDYQTALDEWNKNFGQHQYEFGVGANQWDRNFGEQQRRFDTGVNQDDRNFFYNANRDDRNFNYQSLMDLARLGQYGTTGNAGLLDSLARYLSANTIASGQAGASGTMGGANAINQIISQLLGQYSNNQWMGNVFPGGQ